MESPQAFGELFKKRRMELDMTLREFCRKHELDPGNMSRMERGLLPPPTSKEKLAEYAKMLRIKKGSDDWYSFFDLAVACAGRIPDDIMADEELVRRLPAVFRTMRGEQVTEEQLDELADRIP